MWKEKVVVAEEAPVKLHAGCEATGGKEMGAVGTCGLGPSTAMCRNGQ